MKLESLFAPLGHPLRAGLARTLCLALPFVAATLWAQTPDAFAAPRATFAKYYRQIVGTHWFQWQDQALTGRFDGENYQIGFVTATDTPYPELVAAARDIGATMYRRRFGN